MEQRLREVLNGQQDNYILPFYWQHGETADELREGLRVIRGSGIRAVCVECRPHPDFLGPRWWEDMDVILEEARRLDMRVWVLDDAHFPTGCCNGRVEEKSFAAKRYLDHSHVDALGPAPGASFLVRLEEGEELVAVTAARCRQNGEDGTDGELLRDGALEHGCEEAFDLTDRVRDGLLWWDMPEGYYRITVIRTTWKGIGRPGYLNVIDRAAVKFFLDTVYEPHWRRYADLFGDTFAGFFSDEPELGNCVGQYGFHSLIGQPTMPLPWCDELDRLTVRTWGARRGRMLAALWCGDDVMAPRARYEFMNMVTDLYGRNFCGQLADWCAARGVEYIGHVIEDNGTHSHLGLGTGHYFKALWGQHMAGIDVVLQQIRPGYDGRDFHGIGGKGTYDGVFFHYGLAKLGVSLAQLDPGKKGRCMCEIFGAYGWTEGLSLMKWLADHMLVRGVNRFVPHAFTGRAFPDPDCPPHFYGQGNNPQYPYFRYLMDYMNRVCHLISGGVHAAPIAVLYTAESEWMGGFTPFEKTGRLLTRVQLDYDVVPVGLLENGRIRDGVLSIGGSRYRALVIPACRRISLELAQWVRSAAGEGFPVIFAGELPETVASPWRQQEFFARAGAPGADGDAAGNNGPDAVMESAGNNGPDAAMESAGGTAPDTVARPAGERLPICDLSADRDGVVSAEGSDEKLLTLLESLGVREVRCEPEAPYLRYYRYHQENGEYFLFFNENPVNAAETWVELIGLKTEASLVWYDAFDNRLAPAVTDPGGRLRVSLEAGAAAILCVEEAGQSAVKAGLSAGEAGQSAVKAGLSAGEAGQSAVKAGLSADRADHCGETAGHYLELHKNWKVSLKPYNCREFSPGEPLSGLCDLTGPDRDPFFSGTALYELEFDWDGEESEAMADFGRVYETLDVRLNGEPQAVRIAPPYKCTLRGLRRGKNRLEVYVVNTLVHSVRDSFSAAMPVEPSGLLGPVRVFLPRKKG